MEGSTSLDSNKQCIAKEFRDLGGKKITENALLKAEVNGTLASYFKDHKDEYMCMNYYNAIVVNGRSDDV